MARGKKREAASEDGVNNEVGRTVTADEVRAEQQVWLARRNVLTGRRHRTQLTLEEQVQYDEIQEMCSSLGLKALALENGDVLR